MTPKQLFKNPNKIRLIFGNCKQNYGINNKSSFRYLIGLKNTLFAKFFFCDRVERNVHFSNLNNFFSVLTILMIYAKVDMNRCTIFNSSAFSA